MSNLTEEGSRRSREKLGVVTTMENRQVAESAKIVVLAVKPQFYEEVLSNLTEEGSRRSREKLGVVTTMENRQVAESAKIVVLAVKPQFYEEVLREIKEVLTEEHVLIGIAPGKTLSWLEEKCGQPLKIVRLMPNTPAQVGTTMENCQVAESAKIVVLAVKPQFYEEVLGEIKEVLTEEHVLIGIAP